MSDDTKVRLSDMNLRDLLEALAGDPNQYFMYVPYITAFPEVNRASIVSNAQWVVVGTDRPVDVERTIRNIEELNERGAVPRAMVDGRQIVTLSQAFGVKADLDEIS